MIECVLGNRSSQAPLRVLCLGAHSDDVEIGCGGTILKLANDGPVEVTWIVFSGSGERRDEATESAKFFLQRAITKTVIVKEFRESFFPYNGSEIKDYFETLKKQVSPDVIFTHYRHDLHQDHRLICELTWNTFRNHFILEYEVPKYDGDLGTPNVFVALDDPVTRQKVETILAVFRSQGHRHWFSAELFLSILRLRGVESAASSGYAEAFYARKLILGTAPLPS